MPDISMCTQSKCPARDDCYRYLAVPAGRRQAYAAFRPDEACGYRLGICSGDAVRSLVAADGAGHAEKRKTLAP